MWFSKKKIAPYWRDVELGESLEIGDRFLNDDKKTFSYIDRENLRWGLLSGDTALSDHHKPHQRLVY
jgi:hypothetical protein